MKTQIKPANYRFETDQVDFTFFSFFFKELLKETVKSCFFIPYIYEATGRPIKKGDECDINLLDIWVDCGGTTYKIRPVMNENGEVDQYCICKNNADEDIVHLLTAAEYEIIRPYVMGSFTDMVKRYVDIINLFNSNRADIDKDLIPILIGYIEEVNRFILYENLRTDDESLYSDGKYVNTMHQEFYDNRRIGAPYFVCTVRIDEKYQPIVGMLN